MSWIDKLSSSEFTITCGGDLSQSDSGELIVADANGGSLPKVFKPYWLNATKYVEYNIAEFVFKEVEGSLVRRGTPRGTQYRIEIIFQGNDHLEVSKQFEMAAGYVSKTTKTSPPWRIAHPYYGTIYAHPVSLTFDNTKYNTTTITGTVIQTIEITSIRFSDDPKSSITANSASVQSRLNASYAATVPNMKVSDLQSLQNHINETYAAVSAKINGVQQDVNKYRDAYNAANKFINTVIYNTQQIISQAITLLNTPASFLDTVNNRLNMFAVQFELLNRDINTILGLRNTTTKSLKRLYENNAGATIAAMCVATITNVTNDYTYRPSVLLVISNLITAYNTYLNNICALQTPNGGQPDSYIPDADSVTQLALLVNYTASVLFNISDSAKQQRTMTLPYDTNLLLLANELYGMQQDDSTVTALIESNNIGLSELLVLKQGRVIVYYV